MNKLNDTANKLKMQGLEKTWAEKIEKILPPNLDETAKEYGALKRKKEIKSAASLLRMLLLYATSKMSIKFLSLAACALKISEMSDTAWRKKITNSSLWLAYVLNYFLVKTIKPKTDLSSQKRNIYLIDGTCFRQDGKENNIYRAHMCYCLNTGHMTEVKVTDNHTAEGLQHHNIEKSAIYIADAGYGKARQMDYVVSRQADVIFRVTPNNISFYDKNKNKINVADVLRTKEATIDINCLIRYRNTYAPIRLIASRLPDDKIDEAIKRKKRKSQKNQTVIKAETLLYAEWVIIATSLEHNYSSEEILNIYRSRWQIELLFKRIKQNLKIQTIRYATPKYATALVHLWLIVWAITEKQAYEFEKCLAQRNIDLYKTSKWDICAFFFKRTVSIIDDQWSLLIDIFDVDLIIKYLSISKRNNRRNQFAELTLSNIPKSAA